MAFHLLKILPRLQANHLLCRLSSLRTFQHEVYILVKFFFEQHPATPLLIFTELFSLIRLIYFPMYKLCLPSLPRLKFQSMLCAKRRVLGAFRSQAIIVLEFCLGARDRKWLFGRGWPGGVGVRFGFGGGWERRVREGMLHTDSKSQVFQTQPITISNPPPTPANYLNPNPPFRSSGSQVNSLPPSLQSHLVSCPNLFLSLNHFFKLPSHCPSPYYLPTSNFQHLSPSPIHPHIHRVLQDKPLATHENPLPPSFSLFLHSLSGGQAHKYPWFLSLDSAIEVWVVVGLPFRRVRGGRRGWLYFVSSVDPPLQISGSSPLILYIPK